MNRRYLAALLVFTGTALAGTPEDKSLPFDRYAWVTTHNAFTSNGLIPNQHQTIDEQLDGGVRGLMLDLHHNQGRVRLCHNTCRGGSRTLADFANTTLLPFLEKDPNAIVTLQLDDFTSRTQLIAELEQAPGLVGKTFDPYAWEASGWPTYEAIVRSGQRILIFSLATENSGTLLTRSGAVHIMPSEQFTVENYWSLGLTPLQHDKRCYSRWEGQQLSRAEIGSKPGWRPLFTMNQFHGVPLASHAWTDNALEALLERYQIWCRPEALRKPNYVAVDFHERGDVDRFVDWLNAQPDDES